MRKFLTLVLLTAFLLTLVPSSPANAATDYSAIKVKLTTNNATSLSLAVQGSYFIAENGAEFSDCALQLIVNSDATITVKHSLGHTLYTGKTVSIMRETIDRTAGHLRFNSRNYLGHLYIALTSGGYLEVVNEVPLAHYLYGVVGYEMSNAFPMEALRAQAVAAKCYVLTKIVAASGSYHIGDTSTDQVYKGYNASATNVIQAVESTLYDVLTVNGRLLCMYYAASNGGETGLPSHAWSASAENDAYAISIDDYDFLNPNSKLETVSFSIGADVNMPSSLHDLFIQKACEQLSSPVDTIAEIYSAQAYSPRYQGTTRNMTRCSVAMRVVNSWDSTAFDNVVIDFSFSEVTAFKDSSLRAYWGQYTDGGAGFSLYHARWGHGVGLSQRGAQQRALSGHDYKQILQFYYPGASFSTISVPPMQDPEKPDPLPSGEHWTAQTTGNVNFRKEPSTNSAIITKIPKGTVIPIYARSQGWAYAVYNQKAGYVSEDYLKYLSAPSPTLPPADPTPSPPVTDLPPIGYGTVTGNNVNFRTGPSTSHTIITTLSRGTALTLYENRSGWYLAAAPSAVTGLGYISASYVQPTSAPSPTPSPTPTPTPSPSPSPTDSPGATPSAAPTVNGIITGQDVNFRTGPATSYPSIRRLSKNTGVIVISFENNWYHVRIGEQNGYVFGDYVKIIEGAAGPGLPSDVLGLGKTTGSVNFRSGPSTSHAILATLKKDSTLTLYALKDGWYEAAMANGTRGHISAKYVTLTYANPDYQSAPSGGSPQTPMGMGETTATVNFREGPSTSARKITQLKKGETVTLYSLDNGWYEAGYNGKRGYLFAQYVKQLPSAPAGGGDGGALGLTLAAGRTVSSVNFRTRPSTTDSTIIQKLEKDPSIHILGQTGDWYYMLYNNRTGYVNKPYVSVTDSGSAGIPTVSDTLTLVVTSTTASVNMRLGPGTSFDVVRLLARGAQVTVYLIRDGWCLVKQGGDYGYVLSDHIRLS